MRTWPEIVNAVLDSEGGYVNHPKDPGGETNFGVSKRSHPELDIKNLTRRDAYDIFDLEYGVTGAWDAWRWANGLTTPAHLLLDTAVLFGTFAQVCMMQEALEDLDIDGRYGPKTKGRLAKILGNPVHCEIFLLRFLRLRAQRHLRSGNFDVFGAGWMARLFSILDEEYA